MSTKTRNIQYGIREFDLSEARTLKRINTQAESIAVLRADSPATLHIGDQQSSGVEAGEIDVLTLPETIGHIYISNNANSGKLRLGFGLDGTEWTVPGTSDKVDISDRSARELGKARVMDSSGVLIDPATADAQGNWSGLEYGEDTVTSSGTAQALNGSTSLSVPDGAHVSVKALDGNTGTVYIGDSNVGTADGFPLDPGQGYNAPVTDVSNIHVDADNGGDSIRWIVEV
jgi:hypothetical protein